VSGILFLGAEFFDFKARAQTSVSLGSPWQKRHATYALKGNSSATGDDLAEVIRGPAYLYSGGRAADFRFPQSPQEKLGERSKVKMLRPNVLPLASTLLVFALVFLAALTSAANPSSGAVPQNNSTITWPGPLLAVGSNGSCGSGT